jgi:HlyD family type I secretion membrane fusion protein
MNNLINFWKFISNKKMINSDSKLTNQYIEDSYLSSMLTIKKVYYILYFFIFCILVWASVMPFPGGVVIQGTVIAELHKKPVQHLSGGIIEKVFVNDGDKIKKGQPLLKLKASSVDSQLSVNTIQLLAYQVAEIRLKAEASNSENFNSTAVALINNGSNEFKEIFNNELTLFNSNKTIFETELKAINEIIISHTDQINSLNDSLKSHQRQLSIAKNEFDSMVQLLESGYISKSRLNQYEQAIADIESNIAEDRVAIARTQGNLVDSQYKILQRKQERVREARAQLFDIKRELEIMKAKFTISLDESDRLVLRAPSDGIVIGLAFRTADAVISPGQVVLEISPNNEELIIEGKLSPHQIDGIYVGLESRIRFTAINNSMPVLNGVVVGVSADRILDSKSNESFYLVQIKINSSELDSTLSRKIIAGMPVDVLITTDKRTLLNYFSKPIMGFFYRSLNEK